MVGSCPYRESYSDAVPSNPDIRGSPGTSCTPGSARLGSLAPSAQDPLPPRGVPSSCAGVVLPYYRISDCSAARVSGSHSPDDGPGDHVGTSLDHMLRTNEASIKEK